MKLIIVSGRSGSGKSICLHALEDLGFYCIDNLPAGLLPTLIEHANTQPRIAVGIDARNLPTDLVRFSNIIAQLNKTNLEYEIIYLDADEQTLLRRFSETRRKHPLSSDKISLKEALQQEAKLLETLSELAALRIDTSHLSVHQLHEQVRTRVAANTDVEISLLFQSFGYKFGVPLDADYVFDVRCLPNPYWEPSLRMSTGLAADVAQFLEQQPQTQLLLEDIQQFLTKWLPSFATSNRNYITVAIGCTGGQHRSVYIAEKLAAHFRPLYKNTQVRHREL